MFLRPYAVVLCCLLSSPAGLSQAASNAPAPAAAAAPAQAVGLGLAQTNNCLGCHKVEGRGVGPSFHDIANRYGANPSAADYLVQVLHDGSRGRWGPIPMPRQLHVSAADARVLAEWILGFKPAAD